MQEESRIDYLDTQIKNSRATWYYEGLPEQIECYLHKGDYGQYQRDYFIPDKSLRAKYKDCELFYDNESDPNCSNTMATIRVRDDDLSKAYEIVKAFKEALNKSDRAEKIKTKEIDGALYIYIAPFDAYPEFRMVTPAYRKSAIEDITLSLDDFSRTFNLDLLDGLSDQEKADKIKEETKKEFPKASKADINYVIDNICEYLDEEYDEEEDKMYNTLEEAFKDLNRKHTRRADEGTEVCPDCGKEVCECTKKVNEDIQVTSEEIKDFIAKVGAETIKKALEDFKENVAEFNDEESTEDIIGDTLEVEEQSKEDTEEDVEEKESLKVEDNPGADVESDQETASNEDVKENMNEEKTNIEEDVASSLPATPLPEQAILDYIAAVPKATSEIPPRYFKLGYMSEETYKLAARFRGGRGSINKETGETLPNVRVFKCAEYSRVYVEPYNSSKKTIAAFKEKGKDPQTDILPRKGFHPSALGIRGIFESDLGKGLAFGPLIATNNTTKVQYFISINDEDLRPCTKEDVAQYTPNPEAFMTSYKALMKDAPIEARTQTFFLSKIYMIGNLGDSVVKK